MADKERDGVEEYAEWKQRYGSGDEDPRELFKQISHIALYMSYDMIDKLRYWETETLKQPPEEIEERITHMSAFLEKLKAAYVEFSDVDL